MRITQRQAAQLIRVVDSSGDGKVSKQEFLRMLKMLLSGDDF
jgi:Ca2+-binding EF-hand superfamily protein